MGLKSSLSFSDIEVNVNRLDASVGSIKSAFAEYASMTDEPYLVARPGDAATPYVVTPLETGIEPPTAEPRPVEPRLAPETVAQLTEAFDKLAVAHNDLVRLWKKQQQRLRRAAQQMK